MVGGESGLALVPDVWSSNAGVLYESHFSPRNCTSLHQPILSQELYFENMQHPILSQELYFSKKKFRLENMHDPILSQELY